LTFLPTMINQRLTSQPTHVFGWACVWQPPTPTSHDTISFGTYIHDVDHRRQRRHGRALPDNVAEPEDAGAFARLGFLPVARSRERRSGLFPLRAGQVFNSREVSAAGVRFSPRSASSPVLGRFFWFPRSGTCPARGRNFFSRSRAKPAGPLRFCVRRPTFVFPLPVFARLRFCRARATGGLAPAQGAPVRFSSPRVRCR
jgi:hypothetical protein